MSAFHNWIADKVFDRSLWQPCEHTVARGVALGLFVAMIPVPMQMVIAAVLACYLHAKAGMRINVPAAVTSVWISNPATVAGILLLQRKIGQWLYSILPVLEMPQLGQKAEWFHSVMLGAAVMAPLAALIGYGVTILFWDLIAERLLPSGRSKGAFAGAGRKPRSTPDAKRSDRDTEERRLPPTGEGASQPR